MLMMMLSLYWVKKCWERYTEGLLFMTENWFLFGLLKVPVIMASILLLLQNPLLLNLKPVLFPRFPQSSHMNFALVHVRNGVFEQFVFSHLFLSRCFLWLCRFSFSPLSSRSAPQSLHFHNQLVVFGVQRERDSTGTKLQYTNWLGIRTAAWADSTGFWQPNKCYLQPLQTQGPTLSASVAELRRVNDISLSALLSPFFYPNLSVLIQAHVASLLPHYLCPASCPSFPHLLFFAFRRPVAVTLALL